VFHCGHGWHEEGSTDPRSATLDEALPFPIAAIPVVGSQACQRNDLAIGKRTEFGHFGDERIGKHRPNTNDFLHPLVPLFGHFIGLNEAFDLALNLVDTPLEGAEASLDVAFNIGVRLELEN